MVANRLLLTCQGLKYQRPYCDAMLSLEANRESLGNQGGTAQRIAVGDQKLVTPRQKSLREKLCRVVSLSDHT